MNSLKYIFGYFPSQIINLALRADLSRKTASALVNFVNNHPMWLGAVDEHVLVRTNFDFSIYCNRLSGIGQTLIADGQWEGLLSRTILACVKPGDIAIDIGANIGYDTLLMNNAVGSTGLVLAFEPVAQHLALLIRSIQHTKNNNVVAQSLALSDEASVARITLSSVYNSGMPNLRPGESGPSQPILTARLDRLIKVDQFPRIRFVKIDIEGFEFRAIQGMGQLIEKIDYLTCEINPQFLQQCGTSAEEIFLYMRDHGFMSFCTDPYGNAKWVKSDHAYKSNTTHGPHFDVLFCRRIDDALRPFIDTTT
jgi:FkbM family methyltransferase